MGILNCWRLPLPTPPPPWNTELLERTQRVEVEEDINVHLVDTVRNRANNRSPVGGGSYQKVILLVKKELADVFPVGFGIDPRHERRFQSK